MLSHCDSFYLFRLIPWYCLMQPSCWTFNKNIYSTAFQELIYSFCTHYSEFVLVNFRGLESIYEHCLVICIFLWKLLIVVFPFPSSCFRRGLENPMAHSLQCYCCFNFNVPNILCPHLCNLFPWKYCYTTSHFILLSVQSKNLTTKNVGLHFLSVLIMESYGIKIDPMVYQVSADHHLHYSRFILFTFLESYSTETTQLAHPIGSIH